MTTKDKMVTDTFEVTQQHIDLIQRMYFTYNKYDYSGAPEVDPKRPYGNSDILGDMCEILKIDQPDFDNDEWYSPEEEKYLTGLHEENTKALAILAQHLTISPGKYKQEMYWKWIKDEEKHHSNSELLRLAGKMSDAARAVVGGNAFTIGNVPPAHIGNIEELCNKLRQAVDAYDDAIREAI